MEPDEFTERRQQDDAVEAALAQGEELRKNGQHAESLRVLARALELGVRRASIYYRLGNTYVDKGDLDRAEEMYKKALEVDPDHENARHNLAIVYKRQKRLDLFVKTSKEIRRRAMEQDLPAPLKKLGARTRRTLFWVAIAVVLLVIAYLSSRG